MLKVVLAEDEKYVRKSIVNRVEWAALCCELCAEAETGRQALEAVRNFQPDVLITDIRMPCIDGLAVLQTLRDEGNPLSCIIISGYSDFAYAQQAIRLGVSDFLTKPIDIRELSGVLHRLNAVRQTDTAAAPHADSGDLVEKVQQYIHAHYSESITGRQLSGLFFLSPAYLSHSFKRKMGVGISAYLEDVRMARAKELLQAGGKCKEVAGQVGYGDVSYFIRVFKRRTGCTPMAFSGDGDTEDGKSG